MEMDGLNITYISSGWSHGFVGGLDGGGLLVLVSDVLNLRLGDLISHLVRDAFGAFSLHDGFLVCMISLGDGVWWLGIGILVRI